MSSEDVPSKFDKYNINDLLSMFSDSNDADELALMANVLLKRGDGLIDYFIDSSLEIVDIGSDLANIFRLITDIKEKITYLSGPEILSVVSKISSLEIKLNSFVSVSDSEEQSPDTIAEEGSVNDDQKEDNVLNELDWIPKEAPQLLDLAKNVLDPKGFFNTSLSDLDTYTLEKLKSLASVSISGNKRSFQDVYRSVEAIIISKERIAERSIDPLTIKTESAKARLLKNDYLESKTVKLALNKIAKLEKSIQVKIYTKQNPELDKLNELMKKEVVLDDENPRDSFDQQIGQITKFKGVLDKVKLIKRENDLENNKSSEEKALFDSILTLAEQKYNNLIEKCKNFWEKNIKVIYPELDSANSEGFAHRVNEISNLKYVGMKLDSLELLLKEIGDKKTVVNNDISDHLNGVGVPLNADFTSIADRKLDNICKDVQDNIAAAIIEKGGISKLVQDLRDFLQIMETTQSYKVSTTSDPLSADFKTLEAKWLLVKNKLSSVEQREINLEMQRMKLIVLKNTALYGLWAIEGNEDGPGTMDSYYGNVLKDIFYAKLDIILRSVPDDKKEQYGNEIKRFKEVSTTLAVMYMATKSTRDDALAYSPNSQDEVGMKLPSVSSVFLMGFGLDVIGKMVVAGKLPICKDKDLLSHLEYEVNPTIGKRVVEIFDPQADAYVEKDTKVTGVSETMTFLDMFFNGRYPRGMPDEMRKSYSTKRRDVFRLDSGAVVEMVKNYANYYYINELSKTDDPEERRRITEIMDRMSNLDEKVIRRAWNISIMFYRPHILAPESFNRGAEAYYAFSTTYAKSELIKKTGTLSPFYFFIIGHMDDYGVAVNAIGSYKFTEEDFRHLKANGLFDKFANYAAFKARPQNLNKSIEASLRKKGLFDQKYKGKYKFLSKLPALAMPILHRVPKDGKEVNVHPSLLDPLSNVLVRYPNGDPVYYVNPVSGRRSNTRLMTFSDYVDQKSITSISIENNDKDDEDKDKACFYNPNGHVVWQALPWFEASDHTKNPGLDDENIVGWINQGGNMRNFYKLLFSTEHDNTHNTSLEQMRSVVKVIQYGVRMLPIYGHLIREGLIKQEKVIARLTLTKALIIGISLVEEGKTIEQAKETISNFDMLSHNDKEAIYAVLDGGFGISSMSQNIIESFVGQAAEAMKVK